MATENPEIMRHLAEAQELAGTAAVNIVGQTSEARICELGILHALIALCLIERSWTDPATVITKKPAQPVNLDDSPASYVGD